MLAGYKQLKGKEMDVQECNRRAQIQCLERDTGGEEEGKASGRGISKEIVLPAGCQDESQAKGVHLWPFVYVVLSRVAEAILESPGLFGEGPDEAFSGGEGLR